MNNKDYLAHHGIKGQKWGLRRYQNPDGTYTTAGKARRNKGTGKTIYGKQKGGNDPYAFAKNTKFSNKSDLNSAIKNATDIKNLKDASQLQSVAGSGLDYANTGLDNLKRSSKIKKMKRRGIDPSISNAELQQLINRMDLEERYYNQRYRYENLGKKRASDALKAIGGLTTAGLGTALLITSIQNNNLQGKVLKEQLSKTVKHSDDDYLAHFGIKGQKWGRRRFQNEDGSYNQAGEIRYADRNETHISGRRKKAAQTEQTAEARDTDPNETQKAERRKKIAKRAVRTAAAVAGTAALAGAGAYAYHNIKKMKDGKTAYERYVDTKISLNKKKNNFVNAHTTYSKTSKVGDVNKMSTRQLQNASRRERAKQRALGNTVTKLQSSGTSTLKDRVAASTRYTNSAMRKANIDAEMATRYRDKASLGEKIAGTLSKNKLHKQSTKSLMLEKDEQMRILKSMKQNKNMSKQDVRDLENSLHAINQTIKARRKR